MLESIRPTSMVSEFDLPCTACGHELARTTVATAGAGGVTVAECLECGTRHYPESALETVETP